MKKKLLFELFTKKSKKDFFDIYNYKTKFVKPPITMQTLHVFTKTTTQDVLKKCLMPIVTEFTGH